jgi:hypothetical protein
VAPHHRRQMGMLVRDRPMPVAPTPYRNRRQCSGVTVLCCYLSHHFLACPRPAPEMGEAEESERGTIRLRMVSPIWPIVAEINETRLVGMECEAIPGKSLAQDAQDPLGIEEVLERLSWGFGTCCLRFKNSVATTPAKLTSGWLACLYREGVEPSGPR